MLQLKKFPDIPVSTREEALESRPHPEEPHFRLLAREEGSFPSVIGKEFPVFATHLKRRRSPQERRKELQGLATIPIVPQMSQSIPGKPFSPSLPRLSSRPSTHTTVAGGTDLRESLLGKPRGKASRESHRSLDPREGNRDTANRSGGKRTCMPPLGTRTDSPGDSPEYTKIHVSTGEESSSSRHPLHTRS